MPQLPSIGGLGECADRRLTRLRRGMTEDQMVRQVCRAGAICRLMATR